VRPRARRGLAARLGERLPAGARVGVDLVEVRAVRSRFEERDGLLAQVFTEGELDYCRTRRRPWLHLAARFAAKEATFKALGTGLAGAMGWRDVEVVRDEAGEPSLVLSGETRRRAARAGFGHLAVSLAHGRRYAVAVVLALRDS
jgi:holo-[acyl-carrier protein] synthase